MAHFEELNDINFYIKSTLLGDDNLKKLLFYPGKDALKPSNSVPSDDEIWKVHMFPMERYVDATTDDKTYLNYFYRSGRNYDTNNSFAYVDIIFDIIIYLDADEINEGLRRLSVLNLVDKKFKVIDNITIREHLTNLTMLYPKLACAKLYEYAYKNKRKNYGVLVELIK